MINIHRIECFWWVAKEGGFTQAVRKNPLFLDYNSHHYRRYMRELESDLGALLCTRTPFQLTAAGERLFRWIAPWFEAGSNYAERFGGDQPGPCLRMATTDSSLAIFLPQALTVIHRVKPQPDFTMTMGRLEEMDEWLRADQVDLAITLLEPGLPSDWIFQTVIRAPMVLLVAAGHPAQSVDDLWRDGAKAEKLVCSGLDDPLTRISQFEFIKRGVLWPPSIIVSSFTGIVSSVESNHGVGLSVQLPKTELPKSLRALPLPGFPEINIGVAHMRPLHPVVGCLMLKLQADAEGALRPTPVRPRKRKAAK